MRSCWIHQARSSNPAGSNSKLLADFIEGDALPALPGFEEPLLHRLAAEQVSGLPFRGDLPPEVDGHDDSGGVPFFVRDVLDVHESHVSLRGGCRISMIPDGGRALQICPSRCSSRLVPTIAQWTPSW